VVTSISLPRDLKDELDAAAEEYDISMAEVIRLALIDWLTSRGKHE
jgi:metal-responsive CopG/Arc/MetJ family transcriptional regulator